MNKLNVATMALYILKILLRKITGLLLSPTLFLKSWRFIFKTLCFIFHQQKIKTLNP